MSKVHLFSNHAERLMPDYIFNQYHADGYRGTACGYMRKNTTTDKSKVTCFYCSRKTVTPDQVRGERG